MQRLDAIAGAAANVRQWFQLQLVTNRRWLIGLAAAAGVGSVLCLAVGAGTTNASLLLLITVGGGLGTFSLTVAGNLIRDHVRASPTVGPWIGLAPIGIGLGLAIAASWVAARTSSSIGVTLLIALLALGLVTVMLGTLLVHDPLVALARREPVLWITASVLVYTTSLLSIGTGTPPVLTAVAVGMWVLSLTGLKIGLTPLIRARGAPRTHRRAVRVTAVAAALTLIGVLLLTWHPAHRRLGPEPFATFFSLSVVVAALSSVAIGAVDVTVAERRVLRSPLVWTVVAVGLVAGFYGISQSWMRLPSWTIVLVFIYLFVFGTGVFFVFKGEGLVFLIMIGFLLALVLTNRAVADPAADIDGAGGTLVVLGDSFTSGEGARTFIENTNTQDPSGNWCRRAPFSYAQLIALYFDLEIHNYACSGAKTADLLTVGQFARLDQDPPIDQVVPGRLPQLLDLESDEFGVDPASVDYVLVSIGGNDAQFSTVVQACLLPSDCASRADEWLAQGARVQSSLAATYRAITDAMPNAQVIIMPYPSYVGARACGMALTEDEVGFVRDFLETLNERAKRAATGMPRVHYFDEIDRAYLHHDLCSALPGANFLNLLPRGGPLLDRLAPDSFHNGTAHPNERGHRCTAAVLAPWLAANIEGFTPGTTPIDATGCELASMDDVLAQRAIRMGDPATPAQLIRDPEVLDEVEGMVLCVPDTETPEVDCFDGKRWTNAQLDSLLSAIAVPMASLVLSGMLLALAFTWWYRNAVLEGGESAFVPSAYCDQPTDAGRRKG